MRKKILLGTIVIFFLLASLVPTVQALDNIQLRVNDEVVTDDLPYQIEEENILVPLEILTDTLPVQMRWYESIDTLHLEHGQREVKLRLGDPRLQVNNQLLQLPTAVRLEAGSFLVPLEAMGEALGLMIRADQTNRVVDIFEVSNEVTDIKYCQADSSQALEVKTTDQIQPEVDYLKSPDRIIMDLPGTKLKERFEDLSVDSELVKGVRIAQYNSTTTRVVVDLAGEARYNLIKTEVGSEYKYRLELSPIINRVEYTANGLEISGSGDLQAGSPFYLSDPHRAVVDIENAILPEKKQLEVEHPEIKEIKVEQYKLEPNPVVRTVLILEREMDFQLTAENQKLTLSPLTSQLREVSYDQEVPNRVTFSLSQKKEPRIAPIEAKERLVFDFPGTKNEFSASKLPVDSELINEIRVSQFDQDTTRVVLDLEELVSYQTSWEQNELRVNLLNELKEVKVADEKTESMVNLSLFGSSDYEVHKLFDPQRLVIDLANTAVNLKDLKVINDSDWTREVRVSQYKLDPHTTRVVLDLEENFDFDLVSETSPGEIIVGFNKRSLTGKQIVVDPGHGGEDPGAIGPQGATEAEVALDTALKLRDLLEQAGAEVIMTREEDITVSLDKRAEIANESEADIFISLHANGHISPQPDGTETFIAEDNGKHSRLLGHFLQEEVVDNLGTYDRGLKQENLYVLRNTDLPAVLHEIAFISNPEQEKLLTQEEFRFKAATGIYEGVNQYFNWRAEEDS